jgi:hypothetical protein
MTFKCTTDACTAAFCENGELLAHQTSHDEQSISYVNTVINILQMSLTSSGISDVLVHMLTEIKKPVKFVD